MLQTVHFLRPWWFLALFPAILLFILLLRRNSSGHNSWREYCDPHLLPHLIIQNHAATSIRFPLFMLISWVVAILALAGPTWSLYAQPVYQKNIARVIALDVSSSMNATDIEPSRLERAKYKVLDLLRAIKEGQTGMLVFSSSAFVVSPLTSDSNTIASMIPVLDSSIVPVQGSDIGKALDKSKELLAQAGYTSGEIVLITDSTPSGETIALAKKLVKEGYTLTVLAVGTEYKVPFSNASGNLATDKNGNAVLAGFDSGALQQLAIAGDGTFVKFSPDNTDIEQILAKSEVPDLANKPSQSMQTKNLWKDEGYWLIWLLILLTAWIARVGSLEKLC